MAKLPPYVKTMSRVAAGFGVVQSCVWLVLGSVALASYLGCHWSRADEERPLTSNFTHVIQQYFFLNEYCPLARSLGAVSGVVSAFELHVWAATCVATSGLWLIASMCIFFFVTDANIANVNASLYGWSLVALVVSSTDVALGAVFGVTFTAVGDLINNPTEDGRLPELVELGAVRVGAFLLMMLALRGLVLLLLNLTFSVLLLYYAYLVNECLNRNEHTIHSLGPLHAFQGHKNFEPWGVAGFDYDNQYERSVGAQVNRSYSRAEQDGWQLSAGRRPLEQRDDSNSRAFDRSDSWHQGKAPPRPFSYLEEPQSFKPPPRSPAPAPPAAPTPPWKRATSPPGPPPPSVPAPDYSPTPNRQPRLKSALKSSAY